MLCSLLVPCRCDHPHHNTEYEEVYIDSGSGAVALANMTRNPSYVTAKEVVSTRFSSGPKEANELNHTYEALSFEANEKGQEVSLHRGQGNAEYGWQEATADYI